MGFLEVGEPYTWTESREDGIIEYIRQHGVGQFLAMWDKVKDINNDAFKWGDELEYQILVRNEESGTVRCSLRGADILEELRQREESTPNDDPSVAEGCSWVPEYGSWMVEGTPSQPYLGHASDLLAVERNMRLRRARLLAVLRPDEICPTLPCFPMLGVGQFTEPPTQPGGVIAQSVFVSDAVINPHPRFGALTQNIRTRRGSNVDIRMPRFRDTHTSPPTAPAGSPPPSDLAAALGMDEVYMDAMAFGMGCTCLQVTFQARAVDESRHLYDQLAVLTPMLLALTAATPAARGVLLDTDTRWDIIAQSVDDRTPAERALPANKPAAGPSPIAATVDKATSSSSSDSLYHPAMIAGGRSSQHKSRYASISLYICEQLAKKHPSCSTALNDVPAPYDREAYERLVAGGIDEMLARHVAHLFSRDPLVVFRQRVSEVADDASTEHFENLQSTNWQTVRWKPPPASSTRLGGSADIGWRVEFRSMEVQLTDFENAAFTVRTSSAARPEPERRESARARERESSARVVQAHPRHTRGSVVPMHASHRAIKSKHGLRDAPRGPAGIYCAPLARHPLFRPQPLPATLQGRREHGACSEARCAAHREVLVRAGAHACLRRVSGRGGPRERRGEPHNALAQAASPPGGGALWGRAADAGDHDP